MYQLHHEGDCRCLDSENSFVAILLKGIFVCTHRLAVFNKFYFFFNLQVYCRAMRESSHDLNSEDWREWILDAIAKIRSQKQRPSVQRICQAIGSHHKFHEDIVASKLEEAVKTGTVVKVYNKGLHTYKAPIAYRRIAVSSNTDLSRLVAVAVRELGECDGSSLKSIENYVQKSNDIELAPDTDFKSVVKNSVKIAVEKNYLEQEFKLYKVGKVLINMPKQYQSPRKKTAVGDNGKVSLKDLFFVFFFSF